MQSKDIQLKQFAQQANNYLVDKNWSAAVDILNRMIEIEIREDILVRRGYALLQLQQWQQATADFLQALQINPQSILACEGIQKAQAMLPSTSSPPSTETASFEASWHNVDTISDSTFHSVYADTTMPSSQQFGRYQVSKVLGQGGMGKVYQVYDPKLKRNAALKTILQNQKEDAFKRFMRESAAMARLSHPNIVKIYDIGEENNIHYFTMELIHGKNLSTWIKEENMTVRRAVEIVRKIASAIDYAHQQGILHRDLKPSNILMGEKGEPYVMDFGLAKESKSKTELSKSGAVIGTLVYMPPEQAKGEKRNIDERSDVYSLGAVLYEILTGRQPFQASTPHAIIVKVIYDEPIAPSQISTKIPKEVENICLKAMAKNKVHRYQSASELAKDLERFLIGEPVLASPPGWGYQIVKWLEKNRLFAGALVIFLVAGVIGGIAYYWQIVEANKKLQEEKEFSRKAAISEKKAKNESIKNLVISLLKQARRDWSQGEYQIACLNYENAILQGEKGDKGKALYELMDFARAQLGYHAPVLWQMQSIQLPATGKIPVLSLAFSPNGENIAIVTFGASHQVQLWNTSTGNLITMEAGKQNRILYTLFHPQGANPRYCRPGCDGWAMECAKQTFDNFFVKA